MWYCNFLRPSFHGCNKFISIMSSAFYATTAFWRGYLIFERMLKSSETDFAPCIEVGAFIFIYKTDVHGNGRWTGK